jgi:hypothetical protein
VAVQQAFLRQELAVQTQYFQASLQLAAVAVVQALAAA